MKSKTITFMARIRRQGGSMKMRLEELYTELVVYDITNNSYTLTLTQDQGRSAVVDLRSGTVFVGALWLLAQQADPINPLDWRPGEMLPEDFYA